MSGNHFRRTHQQARTNESDLERRHRERVRGNGALNIDLIRVMPYWLLLGKLLCMVGCSAQG